MYLIYSVRSRDDESETVMETIPISADRTMILATVETALSAFDHHGHNEEQDYWWAWSNDNPSEIHRWVIRPRQ